MSNNEVKLFQIAFYCRSR